MCAVLELSVSACTCGHVSCVCEGTGVCVRVCEPHVPCGHWCMFGTTHMLKGFQAASNILYMEWFRDLGKFPRTPE